MTTNKPEVVAWYTSATRDTLPVVALNDRSQQGEPLIRLSDYEALQAECDTLVEALEEARDLVASWAAYAGDYFKEKHCLARDLERLDAVIAAHRKQGGEA